MPLNTISVVGLGYIGLPTAAMFASKKMHVIGVDVNSEVVDIINTGEIHIVEPDLDILVKTAVRDGYLRAVTKPEPADAFLIAVPTPFLKGNGKEGIPKPDLKFIELAAHAISRVLKKGDLVILESTSPVGTTEKMAAWLAKDRPDLTFPQTHGESSNIKVAHCPERVLPGQVVRELVKNDRLIGGITAKCSEAAIELYKIFVDGECVVTDARTAEMAKLTENAFRDVNIAFANELSMICDKININVWELIELANRHPRVNILQPGPGVGGHCIAVDPWFIVSQTPNEALLINTARRVNDLKPTWVLEKVDAEVERIAVIKDCKPSEVIVAFFGIAFKPNIDDLRESPALSIALIYASKALCKTLVVEPNITQLPPMFPPKVELATTRVALKTADLAVMLVAHDDFKIFKSNDLGIPVLDVVGFNHVNLV